MAGDRRRSEPGERLQGERPQVDLGDIHLVGAREAAPAGQGRVQLSDPAHGRRVGADGQLDARRASGHQRAGGVCLERGVDPEPFG